MRSVLLWIAVVTMTTALGGAFGRVLGEGLRSLSIDNLVFVREYLAAGLRGGAFLGAFFGACAVVGRRATAPGGCLLPAGAVVLSGVACFTLLGGGIAYLLAGLHLLTFPAGVAGGIGHPNRIFFCAGLQWGAVVGAVVWGVVGGLMIVMGRRNA